jgi:hypothetical protein
MSFAARSLGYLGSGGGGSPTTVLSTTLTIGTAASGTIGVNLRGFTSTAILGYTPTTFGSLASATLTTGRTCISVYDDRDIGIPEYSAVLKISGFASDPGRTYLYDVTANSVTKTEATATLYSYSAGTALWEWTNTTTAVLFGFATSGTTPLVIRLT